MPNIRMNKLYGVTIGDDFLVTQSTLHLGKLKRKFITSLDQCIVR